MWSRWLASFPESERITPALRWQSGEAAEAPAHVRSALVQYLLPHDEKLLWRALSALEAGEDSLARTLVLEAASGGSLLPDLKLLAAAFHLEAARFDAACGPLSECYRSEDNVGAALRRMAPALRFVVRIEPCVLLPLYPGGHSAGLMYALALWHLGQSGEALEVLRELSAKFGALDELRLVAGQIYLQRSEPERAIQALTVQEVTQRDSVELARCLHLAFAHYQLEEYRPAARVLAAALSLQDSNNPLLLARANLLLAELYERNGMLLDALRQSAHVAAYEVPQEIAAVMQQREQRWLSELSHLTASEIEHLAGADAYQIYMPEQKPKEGPSPLEVSRDALKQLKPRAQSWLKRREEEQQIEELRAAHARGEQVELPGSTSLSPAAAEVRRRIGRAQEWWPARRIELTQAPAGTALSRHSASEVSHLSFDFGGTREAETQRLQGEVRATLLSAVGGAALLIFIVLIVLRSCVTLFQ